MVNVKPVGRTYFCGEIPKEAVQESVVLKGWVARVRVTSNMIFVLLRDRTGIIQVTIPTNRSLVEEAKLLRSEYVIEVKGTVSERLPININPDMETGTIEVVADEITVISRSKTPPFYIEENAGALEELRLKYRYLDLRRPEMFSALKTRHDIVHTLRDCLHKDGFLEIETPILTKSTPEGARDYLVPSRLHEGHFYALPQSPQIYKQLLMIASFERYYQFARCFRDEDLRSDRQAEFTQLDIEVSFFSQAEIMCMIENLMGEVVNKVMKKTVTLPFAQMDYDEAIARFGVDKPDTRFGMELIDVSTVVEAIEFKVFQQALASGGQVKAINIKGGANKFSRKEIDSWSKFVANYGAQGLAWLKVDTEQLQGPLAKFFTTEVKTDLLKKTGAEPEDLLVFVADKQEVVAAALGNLRKHLGDHLNLYDPNELNFIWIINWPLFEYDEESKRYVAAHHPFTMPILADIPSLTKNQANVRAQAYDLVLNGEEIGGGSMRIYDADLQKQMFNALGLPQQQIEEEFNFLLEAFVYGVPPHGGFAFGLDRLVSLLVNMPMRDVIAFPKTTNATCLMTNSPGRVETSQLDSLHIKLQK